MTTDNIFTWDFLKQISTESSRLIDRKVPQKDAHEKLEKSITVLIYTRKKLRPLSDSEAQQEKGIIPSGAEQSILYLASAYRTRVENLKSLLQALINNSEDIKASNSLPKSPLGLLLHLCDEIIFLHVMLWGIFERIYASPLDIRFSIDGFLIEEKIVPEKLYMPKEEEELSEFPYLIEVGFKELMRPHICVFDEYRFFIPFNIISSYKEKMILNRSDTDALLYLMCIRNQVAHMLEPIDSILYLDKDIDQIKYQLVVLLYNLFNSQLALLNLINFFNGKEMIDAYRKRKEIEK